ncbi:MAG: hypothetical protein ACRDYA_13155 [Egibacteraceae bacterium]
MRRSTWGEAEHRVIDAFVAARLLTSDAMGDDVAIEVAHEALFRQWPAVAAGDRSARRRPAAARRAGTLSSVLGALRAQGLLPSARRATGARATVGGSPRRCGRRVAVGPRVPGPLNPLGPRRVGAPV